MTEIILGVLSFTSIVLLLATFVLGARRLLVPSGQCELRINQRLTCTASVGQRLLDVLNQEGIHLPSACGGAGTCGLCKAWISEGGGEPTPQEIALLPRAETNAGARLACQVPVLGPMTVKVDENYFGINVWNCTVESVRHVSTLISEIVLRLPQGELIDFDSGGFVEVTCPPYKFDFADLEVESEYQDVWSKSGLHSLKAGTTKPVTRAYSMANRPGENDVIRLNIRVAVPPPGKWNIPPGVVSSWLFSLKPGDQVEASGPYGYFLVEASKKEAIFIGGGVGMAPLYSQILDLLLTRKSDRKISYWYGARSKRELYYHEEFEQLDKQHDNFGWHVVLSDPEPEDNWDGPTGFVHSAIYQDYLSSHKAPEDCEYYLCGPPLMVKAVLSMLDDLGVDLESIHYDDFGGG